MDSVRSRCGGLLNRLRLNGCIMAEDADRAGTAIGQRRWSELNQIKRRMSCPRCQRYNAQESATGRKSLVPKFCNKVRGGGS